MSVTDHVVAFIDAMRAAGVTPTETIANKLAAGEFVRFHCDGDRTGKANGWARIFLDARPAGRFGNHRLGIDATWKADSTVPRMSAAKRRRFRARGVADRQARSTAKIAEHEHVAAQAAAMADRAAPADPSHPYLSLKRIAGEGFLQAGAALLVPMRDADGRLWNVQRIFPDGAKRFLKGGRITGLFWLVGGDAGPLCLGEGAGTMSAVRRATGHTVAAAMHKGNLEPVARLLRACWPDRPIVICADDDAHLINNPRIGRNLGLDAAQTAAAAIGARVALPPRSNAND